MIHDEHRDFARALVALARQHGMDHLSVRFQAGFALDRLKDRISSAPVQMTWSQGRHGDSSNIHLESTSFDNLSEAAS